MTRIALCFAAVLLVSLPVFAQSRAFDLTLSAVWVDPQGESVIEDDAELDFQREVGYGLALDVFWSDRISTEFAASLSEPELQGVIPGVPPLDFGSLEMIPLSVALRFHLAPQSPLDIYLGAGAAYVMVGDLSDEGDLDLIDVQSVDFSDEAGILFNAGVNLSLTRSMALNVDAKYIDMTSESVARFDDDTDSDPLDVEINPLLISAGLSFRF